MSVKHKTSEHPAGEAFSSDLEELSDSFHQIRDDSKMLIKKALDSGHSGVSAVREKAVEGVNRGISSLKKMGSNSLDSFGEKIASRPYTSALIAIGAGFMLAKWMRRR
ncbi:MAG TPA: hypothetical protein VGG44_01330 [Tepidisphaeraceae bacterium]|jgi:hypothetical protein